MIVKAPPYDLTENRPGAIIGSKAGFTLAELVLALGIMAIVLTAIISLFTSLSRIYTTQGVAAGVQQVTRAGIDIMTRKIRMAGYNPLNMGNIGIVQADSDLIRFNFDNDGDGTIGTDGEDIAYLLNASNQLVQQKNGNSATNRALVDNVTDLTFRYLDADDLDTNERAAIRTVEVSLTVEEPAGRDKFLSRTYSTRVICRNLSL